MTVEYPMSAGLYMERLTMQSFAHHSACMVLPPAEVHVWGCSLDPSPEVLTQCSDWLSRSEQERAGRLRLDRDRERFILAHGWLRYRLSSYCGMPPGALVFDRNSEGKPFFSPRCGEPHGLRFNLSHSHGQALVAVANGMDVGADLEEIREDVEPLKLAERFFSSEEYRSISGMPPHSQRASFFRYWVGKEAVLKALGTGLRLPLDRCELLFATSDTASVRWREGLECARNWIVRYLPVGPGWVGAVAGEESDWRMTLCR